MITYYYGTRELDGHISEKLKVSVGVCTYLPGLHSALLVYFWFVEYVRCYGNNK